MAGIITVVQTARIEGRDIVLTLTDKKTGQKMGERVYRDLHRYVQATRPSKAGPVMLIAIPQQVEMEFE